MGSDTVRSGKGGATNGDFLKQPGIQQLSQSPMESHTGRREEEVKGFFSHFDDRRIPPLSIWPPPPTPVKLGPRPNPKRVSRQVKVGRGGVST